MSPGMSEYVLIIPTYLNDSLSEYRILDPKSWKILLNNIFAYYMTAEKYDDNIILVPVCPPPQHTHH